MLYKYLLFILFSISFSLCQTGEAQTPSKTDSTFKVHRNVISTDPLFLAFGIFNLNYERAVSNRVALYTRATYEHWTYHQDYDILTDAIQVRCYPSGKAPQGFYTGGFAYYQHEWFTAAIDTTHHHGEDVAWTPNYFVHGNLNSLAVGFIAGYKFIIKKRLAAEFYGGGGINSWWGKNEKYAWISFDNDVQPQFGINVGYAFR